MATMHPTMIPRIQRTSIYTICGAVAALLAPVESYTMRPTLTNWQSRNYMTMTHLMDTLVCQPQPSCWGWKGCIHNHHDLIESRCVVGVMVLWSNNASVDIETKESTQLLKDEQTETEVGNGGTQYTYINILWRTLIIYQIQGMLEWIRWCYCIDMFGCGYNNEIIVCDIDGIG